MKRNLHLQILFVALVLCMVSSLSATVNDITEPVDLFIIHSSGCHLGCAPDKGGVLEDADVSKPMKIRITPTEDGYYTLSPEGEELFLSLKGKWNTSFLPDGESDNAQFSIESVGKYLIRFKCRANKKYLGTDGTADGAYVYADKSGTDPNHLWYLSEDVDTPLPVDNTSYVINPDAERQMFDGWGVSLCWWASVCGKWSDDRIDQIIDWLVNPDGLNFRIFRYNIGGGDDPDNAHCDLHHMGKGKGLRAEMEGFKDSSDGDYIWSRDAAQRKIMLRIKEKRPDAVFEAFSNSAPWYMTVSGCVAGNEDPGKDNLRPECYEEFAHYLVDVCRHYKDEYGIEFRTLDPFNEPMTKYWGANGGQEGCHFDVQSQIDFLKVLHPILKESGLKTVISAADETAVGQSVADFLEYQKAGVLDLIGQFNTHTYSADNKSRARLSALCADNNIPLWMSEVGAGGSGISGNLQLARKLIDDMRHIMPAAWIDWQYIEPDNDQWCLIRSDDFDENKVYKVKNYSIRAHFSRYIKEGYTMMASLDPHTLVARTPAHDRLVLVVVNSEIYDVRHSIDLSMYRSVDSDIKGVITDGNRDLEPFREFSLENSVVTFNMPPLSIVTLEIPVTAPEKTDIIQDGASYLISPRASVETAMAADADGVSLAEISSTPAQRWTLETASGGYRLINGDGLILTGTKSGYSMNANSPPDSFQTFSISKINDAFFKITCVDNGKVLDMSKEGITAGTEVGLWNYDDSNPSPVHRQWNFVRLPAEGGGSGVGVMPAKESCDAPFGVLNPVSGVLIIVPYNDEAGDVGIYNASGMNIYRGQLTGMPLQIPVRPGYYIVSLESGSGRCSAVTLIR